MPSAGRCTLALVSFNAPPLLDLIGSLQVAAGTGTNSVLTLSITDAPAGEHPRRFGRLYGFDVTAGPGSTAAAVVDVTVAGLQGPDLVYKFTHHLAAEGGPEPLVIYFPVPLRTAEAGTDITITLEGSANAGEVSINAYAAFEG